MTTYHFCINPPAQSIDAIMDKISCKIYSLLDAPGSLTYTLALYHNGLVHNSIYCFTDLSNEDLLLLTLLGFSLRQYKGRESLAISPNTFQLSYSSISQILDK